MFAECVDGRGEFMDLKLTMDGGEQFIVPLTFEEFMMVATNEHGVPKNEFLAIHPGIWINPTHISSIREHR